MSVTRLCKAKNKKNNHKKINKISNAKHKNQQLEKLVGESKLERGLGINIFLEIKLSLQTENM